MILAAALLIAATQPTAAVGGEWRFTGPALVCGEAFALRLTAGESLILFDPGLDYIVYHAQATDGPFLLYEGNAPQPHDDEIRTGISFPNVIAIHDNRPAEAKARSRIRDRLLVGPARAALCPAGQARP